MRLITRDYGNCTNRYGKILLSFHMETHFFCSRASKDHHSTTGVDGYFS